MNTKVIQYAYFCDSCGNSHTAMDMFFNAACEKCGSTDITRAETYSRIQYDDAECEERLAQIRGEICLPNYTARFLRRRQAS